MKDARSHTSRMEQETSSVICQLSKSRPLERRGKLDMIMKW